MKRIHLARWSGSPEGLEPLIAAARAIGLRIGWLEGGPAGSDAEPIPPGLDAAAGSGAFRSVALAASRSVAVKSLGGPPVLRDLLREHFLGCALVAVAEGSDFGSDLEQAPSLEATADGYRVTLPGGAGRDFAPDRLAERLRRPRPWD